jgi:hypothetical protein
MSTTPSASPQPSAGAPAAPPSSGSGLKVFLWILGIFAAFVVLIVVAVAGLGFFAYHKAKQAGLDSDLMRKNPGLAAAKMLVTANPDTELISSNDDAGTIVVKDKKTGKVVTMKFDPEKKSMVVTDENGKTASMQIDTNKGALVVTDDQGKTATISGNGQSGTVQVNGADGSTVKMGANADKPPAWVPVYPGSSPQSTFSAASATEQSGTYTFVAADRPDKILSYYEGALKAGGMRTSNTLSTTNGKVSGFVSGSADGDKRSVMVTVSGETDGSHVGVVFSSKQ